MKLPVTVIFLLFWAFLTTYSFDQFDKQIDKMDENYNQLLDKGN